MNLELAGVSQGYGKREILRNLNLRLKPGVVGLLGPNGAGKSTLLRTLATVMPPRKGEISVLGNKISSEKQARAARSSIGYLPQSFGYDPGMNVADFVTHGAWVRGLQPHQWTSAVEAAISRVDLTSRSRTKMRKLSGGMRQRAGIAWAIVGEPPIVLLDEPTVGLDPQQRIHFRNVVKSLTSSTVILSTHMTDDIAAICQEVIVLYDGAIRFQGTTDQLAARARPDHQGDTDLERGYMSILPMEDTQP
jgi:ABC-2 type transport system ATP-binding protein